MATDATTTFVTREEYLLAERESAESKCEWIDGEVREMSGATLAHVVIVWNLAGLLRDALRRRPLLALPNDMKVRVPDDAYFYPDLVVVPDPPEFEDERRDIVRNPVVVFEVLSPSTEGYDRGEKLDAYRRVPTLRDYVLVAQDERRIDHFTLHEDGVWRSNVLRGTEETLTLASLACELPLAEVYDRVFADGAGA